MRFTSVHALVRRGCLMTGDDITIIFLPLQLFLCAA